MPHHHPESITTLTVELLSAYFRSNAVPLPDLAELIRSTRSVLGEAMPDAPLCIEDGRLVPAISVRRTLSSPDYILSLIDGKPYKALKRHISRHGLTPEGYREKFNLPPSYPMVAPSLTRKRSEIAKAIGLGGRKSSSGSKTSHSPSQMHHRAATLIGEPA